MDQLNKPRFLSWLKFTPWMFEDDPNAGGAGGDGGSDPNDPVTPGAAGGGSGDGGGDGDKGEQFFLTVNERTRFRTADEAIQSYQRASDRISQLSPYEKVVKEYGVQAADDLKSLLDELRERRERETAGDRGGDKGGKGGGEEGPDLSKLSPKDRAAVEWLIKQGPTAGFVSRKDYDALKAEIDSLKAGNQTSEDERFNQRVETGQAHLGRLLEDSNFPIGGKFASGVEKFIASWIDEDKRRIADFYAGGERLRSVVAAGFQEFKDSLGEYDTARAAAAAGGRRTSSGDNRDNRGRFEPRGSGGGDQRRTQTPNNQRTQPNNRRQKNEDEPDTEDQAWDVFQRVINGEDRE